MANLSNIYNVKYKTRNFPGKGIKGANKLSIFKKHYDIPPFMPGSRVTSYHKLWDFLSVVDVEDTTFVKSKYSYENYGWGVGTQENYGAGAPSIWNCSSSYNGQKTYNHRLKDPEGNIIDETFGHDRIIRIDSTMSPSEDENLDPGSNITFTGVVIGNSDMSYQLRIEFENDSLSTMTYNSPNPADLGNLYDSDVFTLPNVSQTEGAKLIFEVTWDDGQVQRDEVNFNVYVAP